MGLPVLLFVVVLGCSPENPLPTAVSQDDRDPRADAVPNRAQPDRGDSRDFYPLQIGNRWRYSGSSSRRENGTILKQGSWTRDVLLARYEPVGGRTYVREEGIHRDGLQEFRTVGWKRQDRTGLYEAGPSPPARDSVSYSHPHETRLLAYPMHRGACWVIDEARRITAVIDRTELVDTPAGRFPAWKIRARNGGHLTSEEVFVWYGRAGYLGMTVHAQFERTSPTGETVVIVDDQAEWLESIDLIHNQPGEGVVLGTATITSGGSLVGDNHRVRPTFAYGLGNAAIERALFNDAWIDSTSVGSILVATARSDVDFSAVAASLTNGSADFLCVGTCEEISCGATCSEGEGRLFGLATPDFGTVTIDKISLQIDSLSFGRDGRGGQIVQYTFTIRVHGTAHRRSSHGSTAPDTAPF
jgi:hypothetical protein